MPTVGTPLRLTVLSQENQISLVQSHNANHKKSWYYPNICVFTVNLSAVSFVGVNHEFQEDIVHVTVGQVVASKSTSL